MRHALACILLALVHVTACAAPDAVTAPNATAADPHPAQFAKARPPQVAQTAEAPTTKVDVALAIDYFGTTRIVSGLEALYHTSRNNEWLKFAPHQPAGIVVEGPGRVQYRAGKNDVNAAGVLVALLPTGEELRIDLAQLELLQRSPFVPIGPGGGCIVAIGVLRSPQHPGGTNVVVRIEFAPRDD